MDLITIDQIREQNYKPQEIQIKVYLPLAAKRALVKTILGVCVTEEFGIKRVDFALREFAYETAILNQYTNIDCNVEDFVSLYDELKQHGVIDYVLNQLPGHEIDFIYRVLQNEIEQIHSVENSVEMVIAKALNNLVERIPDQKNMTKMINKFNKEVSKISPETIDILKNINKQ